jgi:hypothetical protein
VKADHLRVLKGRWLVIVTDSHQDEEVAMQTDDPQQAVEMFEDCLLVQKLSTGDSVHLIFTNDGVSENV